MALARGGGVVSGDRWVFLLRLVASPFFLFYAIYYLGSEFSNLGAGLRSRQNFRRMLEAAAINPHDGEAQYQLGLIHQQRHQYTEAIRRFQAAVTIDPTETDAHFQLGRIAREQGRINDALAHLETVLRQDEKHSLSEIHRELGAVYLALGRLDDARPRTVDLRTAARVRSRRSLLLRTSSANVWATRAAARTLYLRAVEAARTAPRYRRRFTARWSRLAQKQARKLSGGCRYLPPRHFALESNRRIHDVHPQIRLQRPQHLQHHRLPNSL